MGVKNDPPPLLLDLLPAPPWTNSPCQTGRKERGICSGENPVQGTVSYKPVTLDGKSFINLLVVYFCFGFVLASCMIFCGCGDFMKPVSWVPRKKKKPWEKEEGSEGEKKKSGAWRTHPLFPLFLKLLFFATRFFGGKKETTKIQAVSQFSPSFLPALVFAQARAHTHSASPPFWVPFPKLVLLLPLIPQSYFRHTHTHRPPPYLFKNFVEEEGGGGGGSERRYPNPLQNFTTWGPSPQLLKRGN